MAKRRRKRKPGRTLVVLWLLVAIVLSLFLIRVLWYVARPPERTSSSLLEPGSARTPAAPGEEIREQDRRQLEDILRGLPAGQDYEASGSRR